MENSTKRGGGGVSAWKKTKKNMDLKHWILSNIINWKHNNIFQFWGGGPIPAWILVRRSLKHWILPNIINLKHTNFFQYLCGEPFPARILVRWSVRRVITYRICFMTRRSFSFFKGRGYWQGQSLSIIPYCLWALVYLAFGLIGKKKWRLDTFVFKFEPYR